MTTEAHPEVQVKRYTAFTDDPAGGNPAGVVLDATDLTELVMQRIAMDVGYSETAFAVHTDDAARRYRVRYFSPAAEVPFCGHATVATAIAIAERIGPGEITFDVAPGELTLTVTEDQGRFVATFTTVPAHSRAVTDTELAPALDALGWTRDELDPAYPPAIAFAGGYHLVLAAATRERLADLHYDFDALATHMRALDLTTVHLVWAETPTLFHVRNPFPVGGVVEDPATGAAAGAFGAYLRELGVLGLPTTVHLRQGDDMGRPSRLRIDIGSDDPRIRVTGAAVPLPAQS